MTFLQWKLYFLRNRHNFALVDWNDNAELQHHERRTIAASIAQFQRGENSEGKNLMRYARIMGDFHYIEAVTEFIREEQMHAAGLARFMAVEGLPRIGRHWVDSVFRWLRTLSGLEVSITVLITAELIATAYYKALRDATRSLKLQAICNQILLDEEMHINFQSFTLRKFFVHHSPLRQKLSRIAHRILMAGTIGVVWLHHRKVLKAGGYTLSSFFRDVFDEFNRSERMLRGTERITMRTQETVAVEEPS